MPARVVAPTSVNGGRSILIERAAGTFADHDVDLKVFQRGIQNFFDDRAESMYLIDKQHVVLFEIRQYCGQIAGSFEHRPRGLPQIDAHLARDDVRQCGLAETRRTEQQHMIERLRTIACCFYEDAKLLADLRLPDVFGERSGTQRALDRLLIGRRRNGGDDALGFGH